MQSWGISAHPGSVYSTYDLPSRSGVLGLVANALGYDFDADLTKLNTLRFGVRVDRTGQKMVDFQTVHPAEYTLPDDFDMTLPLRNIYHHQYGVAPFITNREYLMDAVFLVGLETEDTAFLTEIKEALLAPARPCYLGRKACPVNPDLVQGISTEHLESALQKHPYLCAVADTQQEIVCRFHIQSTYGSCLRDTPISFSLRHHTYTVTRYNDYMEVISSPKSDATITEKQKNAFAAITNIMTI
jgi:CRISPR system Cascade subunit CasD